MMLEIMLFCLVWTTLDICKLLDRRFVPISELNLISLSPMTSHFMTIQILKKYSYTRGRFHWAKVKEIALYIFADVQLFRDKFVPTNLAKGRKGKNCGCKIDLRFPNLLEVTEHLLLKLTNIYIFFMYSL